MRQLLLFILFAGLLCWIIFTPIYKHVVIMRQAILQKEVDYLLEIGASAKYGYIDQTMIEMSQQRLKDRGFNRDEIIYNVSATNGASGSDPFSPVQRGEGIQLQISYPYEHLFEIDKLLAMETVKPTDRMSAFGIKMSEYVP